MPCMEPDDRTPEQRERDYQYSVDLRQRMTYLEKTDFLLFGCPLAALLCETCKKLIDVNMLGTCSPDIQRWWSEHEKRDNETVKRSPEEIEVLYTKLHQILLRNMYPNYKFKYYADVKEMVKLEHYKK